MIALADCLIALADWLESLQQPPVTATLEQPRWCLCSLLAGACPAHPSAARALQDIGLHVDNCLGGFYLSFLSRQGGFSRPWDFALPGVTTISIDIHK